MVIVLLFGVLVLFSGLVVLALVLPGKSIRAPDWLRAQVESRIERSLPGLDLAFGGIRLDVSPRGRPSVHLRDVVLDGPDGQEMVRLSDASASFSLNALSRGKLRVKRINLAGAQATVRRDKDGVLSLSFGGAPLEKISGIPQLIESWDQLFVRPMLDALVSVELQALTVRWEDARAGDVWTLDGGRVRLDRTGSDLRLGASFALLSGDSGVSAIEMNYASQIGDTAADFGITVDGMDAHKLAAQGVALAWLDVLRAPISGALRGSLDAEGALGPVSATLQIGAGVLQPNDETRPIPFSGARTYFTYRPDSQVLVFDELSVTSEWGSGLIEGRARLNGVGNGTLTDLVGQFMVDGLTINPEGNFDAPVTIDRAAADFRMELNPFRLSLGQLHVADGDTNATFQGEFLAAPEGWVLDLDGRLDAITPERAVVLWPAKLSAKPRAWTDKNLSGGTVRDLDFALRARPGKRPRIALDFDFADVQVIFNRHMPPVVGAFGHVSLADDRFVATASAGHVVPEHGGPMNVSGTSFIIPDVTAKPNGPGIARVRAQGQVTSVLSLLNRPPLNVLKNTPLPVDLADGRVSVAGTVALPIGKNVPFETVQFHFGGEIIDVASTVPVPGRHVSAPALKVKGDHTAITISGPAYIEDVPARMAWRQPIGKGASKASRMTGTIELSPRLIDALDIGLPKGSVAGRGTGAFELDIAPGNPPTLKVTSDLTGLRLRIPELSWTKSEGQAGNFALSARLAAPVLVDGLDFSAAGLAASGTVRTNAGGGLDRAVFNTVRLGGWLSVGAEFVGKPGGPPDLNILSGTLDMRRSTFGSSSSGGSGGSQGTMGVALDRLQVSDTISLSGFSGQFSTAGGLKGPFRGRVNGQTEVSGDVRPQGGRSAFTIRALDAGGVFRSIGILDQARGGSLEVVLTPAEGTGVYNGRMRANNVRIKDAPVMAALLNAISVVGLLNELAGQGIHFNTVLGRFRLDPSRLTVYEGSATGPSIGLSMDGSYDLASTRLNLKGVISPVYLLNSVGAVLTRRGEGLIGFSYTLTGLASDPAVAVNPLSALAPGMLRDVFRGAPPTQGDPQALPRREPRRAPDPQDGSDGGR